MSLDLASFAEGSGLRTINTTLDDKIGQAAKRIRAVAFMMAHASGEVLNDEDIRQFGELMHELADGIVDQVEHATIAVRTLLAVGSQPVAKKAVRS